MENIGSGVEWTQWLWGAATAAQLGWGLRSYTQGFTGDSRFMPVKAFAVASLFVGSAASASVLILRSNGIHKVDDLIEAGANLRAKLGLPPRKQDNMFIWLGIWMIHDKRLSHEIQ
ncbi:uncharacterized protein LOC110263561 isoform X2 [Arachis ipaensis]|nr:uncharacterized protein LOC110263561 isoform X2 [Arachis ipaensis]XP_025659025.1 uncharacterized protein LOC112755265 isoform X1 [Arachis hypogaea]QHN87475.1 hypothetical protein DS421_16g555430 [Arachis hypogaea]